MAQFSYPSELYNTRSAQGVLPQILRLLRPASVVDVGCGIGSWLSVCINHGIDDVVGIDQELPAEYMCHRDRFIGKDLRNEFELERKFDLVICLEVAEHLPPASADGLVKSLCALGETVLFSAAIPSQGGNGHINEQWPSYWWDRFSANGFFGSDALRWTLWDNDDIEWWYRQNLMVFSIDKTVLSHLGGPTRGPICVVHPECFKCQNKYLGHVERCLDESRCGLYGKLRRWAASLVRRFSRQITRKPKQTLSSAGRLISTTEK